MAASVHAQGLGSKLPPLRMTASQLSFQHQDVKTPPTMASDSRLGNTQSASLDHLLAHLESSKQALEHQVQQLLQENRLSKSAKKEQQWQIEGERLHSKLDSMTVALMEKEERIRKLEKELRDARGSIQQVQSRCREAEKEKERGALKRANMQADLEDAQMSFQNLEREYKSKQDVVEKQRRALESLADKVEKQREHFQNQLKDWERKLAEAEEREQKYELAAQLASQCMNEKERQLKSLRDAHEKLLAGQKDQQEEGRHEVKEVILALESAHAKCDEQKSLIKEMEQELSKIRKEAHHLDARVAVAEADASSKASMLKKVQLELKNSVSHAVPLTKAKAQVEEMKAQVETLKRNLQDVEITLHEENGLRFKAECALNEFKVREKSLLKIEQDSKALQEEAKWKNEQFQALEEAHNRMRDQFHEGRSMWASEKAAILRDIEVLTENIQSRDIAIHDLRSQLKLLNQSLAHEENCRKLLEFQLADANAGMENVSAEFMAVQSILESLRENSKNELTCLKETLTEKDIQLKELHVRQTQIDRDQKELTQLEVELERYKNSCELLQQTLEKRIEKESLEKEIGVNRNGSLDSNLQDEREQLMKSLSDAEAIIASKEVEMKELEMELDRTRTLLELLRTSMLEAEEEHLRENSKAVHKLEELTASLSAKEQVAMKLETELTTFKVVVNDVRDCNAEAARRITLLEDRLRGAQRELQAKNNLNQPFLNVLEQENVVPTMQSRCEALQRQISTSDFEKFELEKRCDKLIAESREKKQKHQKEKEELLPRLEHLSKQCTFKDMQLNDLLDQITREKEVINTLEARCAISEQQLAKQLLLTEHAREELITEKLNAQAYKDRAQILDASLAAEAAGKDACLNDIKDSLFELTALCKGGAQVATSQTLRLSSIEEKLQQQDALQGTIDERLVSLLGELNTILGEVERIAQGVAYLNTEFHSLEDDSRLNKSEFETRLRAVEGLFLSSCAELKKVSQQVGKTNVERVTLVDSLTVKEKDLDLLKKENESLGIDRSRLEANANDLEERLLKMVKDSQTSKAIIDTLNLNLEAAEACRATRSEELIEHHGKLEESEEKSVQLLSATEQARGLEHKLKETEAIVHDKEERLAASEWAVQQLASEIAKSKSYLAQKEKDETVSRDRLSLLESQIRGKEREVMELQCDLENAVKASNEKHAVVQQLTCSKQDLGYALDSTKRALEEKTATLSASEAEVKRLVEVQRLTQEALETCKERLSNEVKTSLAREKDMERLCADIEKANQETSLADVHVKDLQERLKCLERTTEARLESYERKMEKRAADLDEYKENCAGLLNLMEKKDATIYELESEAERAGKELAKQALQIEHGTQELNFVSQQLQSKSKMYSSLKVEHATVDGVFKELEIQKRGLEEELIELKSLLSLATQDLKEKFLEIEEQRKSIERLETLTSQQRDAHAVSSKELQVTSSAVEEMDNRLSNMQSHLTMAHDDLQSAYESVSKKEGEKRVLVLKVSELENLVEQGKRQASQMQASLQLARANLEAETERFWQQVAARNEIETDRDAWKERATALTGSAALVKAQSECSISKLQIEVKEWKEVAEHTENLSEMELHAWKERVASLSESKATMNAEFECSIIKLQAEVKEWKDIAEDTQLLNAELEKSMQAVQESVVGWEKIVTFLADDGDVVKLQLDILLKQVHDEFRGLQSDFANSKDLVAITCREGHTLKDEILSFIKDSQAQVEAQTRLQAVLTDGEERRQYEIASNHLQAVISDLQRELSVWEAKAVQFSATEVSLQEAHVQLNEWRQRAEEWASFNEILEQAFLDLEHVLLECKSDLASIADSRRTLKLDIRASFQSLRKEVEEANAEMLNMKDDAALEAKETIRVRVELEGCVSSLQAEVEHWKEKAAVAAEEGSQMKDQFEELLKDLKGELKTWKLFEAFAREEKQLVKAEVASVGRRSEGNEGDDPGVFTANSINPFHQEDEGCSPSREVQDNDDAAAQLQGWKSKALVAAKEGRSLTRQFRASFKHLHSELESRKHAPKMVKHESFVVRHVDTGLESLVKALQEEAVEVKAELADWRNKAASAAHETATLKEDMENTISKLKAEVEGWKDRSAMSAGQRIVARRQLEDFAKQVKSLNTELQKWKDVATESNEGSSKLQNSLESVQKENEDLKAELQEWMQKALEQNCSIKDLETDLEKWKQSATSGSEENRLHVEELEHSVRDMHTEVEKWKYVAAAAEEEGKSAKLELLDTLGRFEDDLEVMSSNSIGECCSVVGRALKEEELDYSSLSSGRISSEWNSKSAASELEMSLLAEVEDWKNRVISAETGQEDLRQHYKSKVIELHLEVEAWKNAAACAAEDARLERVELEKILTENQAKASDVADERKRSSLELTELRAELQNWKVVAADAAEKCTSLRGSYEKVTKELQLELTHFKERAERGSEEEKSVKADLEKVVKDLQKEVLVWKEKAEAALEGVAKNQEYEDLISALEEELCLWTQRTQEGKSLQLQLEKEQSHLKESLTATQNELQKWKQSAAAATTSNRSLREESTYVIEEDNEVDTNAFQLELQMWKSKAKDGELLQLQLENLLAETLTELQEWKQKAAAFSLASKTLKEELDCVIEEGRLEKEELRRSIRELDAGLSLWQEKAQECDSLQTQSKNSQTQLQNWEEKAAVITQSTRSIMKEFDLTVEGQSVNQRLGDSISVLKASVLALKEKVTKSESTQVELRSALLETLTELQDWKDRAAAVAVATTSMKEEIDSILDANRVQKEKLCNKINELEAEVFEWKSRAQEGVSVQIQFERALSEMEEKAAAASSNTRALKDELDSTIAESSSEIHQLCSAIAGLEAELSELKHGHFPQLPQLQTLLTETQSQVQEWQEKAVAACHAEDELRHAVEGNRSQTVNLHNLINALKDDLLEWQERAANLETLQLQLTSSITTLEDELQLWKRKATDATMAPELESASLSAELSEWKKKAQEGEFLHQQMIHALSETRVELQDLREKMVASTSFTDSLKDALSSANELTSALTSQLSTQKQNAASLQKVNRQLEVDLVQVREENFARKQKMTQILTQLEGTSNSQKELQTKLHLAQHRFVGNEKHRSPESLRVEE